MTAMRLPGPLGSLFNSPGLDAGTLALMLAPRPRTAGASVAAAGAVHPTLRRGDHHARVLLLRQLLNERLRPSPALARDEAFDLDTELALRRFQQACGLRADGIAGRRTWAALQRAEPPREPAVGAGAWASLDADYPDAPWMALARAEMGEAEISGARSNPRIVAYHASTSVGEQPDETPWCSSFVNWVLREAAMSGSGSSRAASWLDWGAACAARAGSITVIHNPAMRNTSLSRSGNHVGFLVRDADAGFVLLGGNQHNEVRVSRFRKPGWVLKGHRWPSA